MANRLLTFRSSEKRSLNENARSLNESAIPLDINTNSCLS